MTTTHQQQQCRNRDIITADLVKKRYELQRLTGQKSEILARENGIYQTEVDRIKCKQSDDHVQYRDEHTRCLAEYMTLVEKKTRLDADVARLEALNRQCEQDTLDRRKEYRRAIAMKNAADFAARNSNNQLSGTLTEVNYKIAEIDAYLAQYPEFRRQINEDYYNWQLDTKKLAGELEKLTALTMDLTLTGRKVTPRILNHQARLQKIVSELAEDKRQIPEARYQELDKSMEAHRNQRRIWENRRQQLETRLANPPSKNENVPQTPITLSPYFKDDVEQYKLVKKQYESCTLELCDISKCLANMHNRLIDLSAKCGNMEYMSSELQQQHSRAHERLQRVNARLDDEYNNQISEVRARILELETVLAKSSVPDIDSEPLMNIGPLLTMPVVQHEHQSAITGKNRRELKLAQMQAMSASGSSAATAESVN